MRKLSVLFIVLCSLLFMCSSNELSKGAITALKKLASKTEVGVSYNDYSATLGDVNYEVNKFMESKEAKRNPELAKSISKVMDHYKTARQVWEMKFHYGTNGIIYLGSNNSKSPIDNMIAYILKNYPEVASTKVTSGKDEMLSLDVIISIIWGAASRELKVAASLVSK